MGLGTAANPALALELARRSAEAGDNRGQYLLAEIYRSGSGTAADLEDALFWYQAAARGGYVLAQLRLAELLLSTSLGPAQPLAAYAWLVVAAANGSEDAANLRERLASRLDEQTLAAAEQAASELQRTLQPGPHASPETSPSP